MIIFVKIDSSSSKSSHQQSAAELLLLELSMLTKIITIITKLMKTSIMDVIVQFVC